MLYFAEDVGVHFEDEGGVIGFFFDVLRVLEVVKGEGRFFQGFGTRWRVGNWGLCICSHRGVRYSSVKKRWWIALRVGVGVWPEGEDATDNLTCSGEV